MMKVSYSLTILLYYIYQYANIMQLKIEMLSEPEDYTNESEEECIDEEEGNRLIEDIESEPDDVSVSVKTISGQSLALTKWAVLFLLTLQSTYQLSTTVINSVIKLFLQILS